MGVFLFYNRMASLQGWSVLLYVLLLGKGARSACPYTAPVPSSFSKSLERLRRLDVSGATGAKMQKADSIERTSPSMKNSSKART